MSSSGAQRHASHPLNCEPGSLKTVEDLPKGLGIFFLRGLHSFQEFQQKVSYRSEIFLILQLLQRFFAQRMDRFGSDRGVLNRSYLGLTEESRKITLPYLCSDVCSKLLGDHWHEVSADMRVHQSSRRLDDSHCIKFVHLERRRPNQNLNPLHFVLHRLIEFGETKSTRTYNPEPEMHWRHWHSFLLQMNHSSGDHGKIAANILE
jgi:hypothetical protein